MKKRAPFPVFPVIIAGFFELLALAFMVFLLFPRNSEFVPTIWSTSGFLVFFQIYTCLFLVILSDSLFKKRRLGLWFSGLALIHLLYAVLFYFMHAQLGAVILLPALAFLSLSLLCTWCRIERRWGILLLPLVFFGFGLMAAREYSNTLAFKVGVFAFVFLLIGIMFFLMYLQYLIAETRLWREGIARINKSFPALMLITVGAGDVVFFRETPWLMAAGGVAACAGIAGVWCAWPRRRVTAVRLTDGFVAGAFHFSGDHACFEGARVILLARNPADDESADTFWKSEVSGVIFPESSGGCVPFVFEKPKLRFKPREWLLMLILTRQGGKVEKYNFQVKPVKRKGRKDGQIKRKWSLALPRFVEQEENNA